LYLGNTIRLKKKKEKIQKIQNKWTSLAKHTYLLVQLRYPIPLWILASLQRLVNSTQEQMAPKKKLTFNQIVGRGRHTPARHTPYAPRSPRSPPSRLSPDAAPASGSGVGSSNQPDFIPAPTSTDPAISRKRLHGYRLHLERMLPAPSDRELLGKRRSDLINLLLKLSVYSFHGWDVDFAPSGIMAPVEALSRSAALGEDVQEMARELWAKWEQHDLGQRLLTAGPAPTPEPEDLVEITWDELMTPAGEEEEDPETPAPAVDESTMMEVYERMVAGVVHHVTETGKKYPRLAVPARPANRFGHNGLALGTWWPLQLCARRDGAHGAPVAGIYGQLDVGAFSVISSGASGYEASDEDNGDVLYYSGSNGWKPDGSTEPVLTAHTRVLMRSCETGRPVRVIRAKGSSRWAPAVGFRYDGLYTVVEHEIARRKGKGLARDEEFYRFKMVRCADQEPLAGIRARSPTNAEKVAYRRYEELRPLAYR